MKQTAEPSLKSFSDRLRETLYPLAFVFAIGSLWGFAWAQRSVDLTQGHEYYPPLLDENGHALVDLIGQDLEDSSSDEAPQSPSASLPGEPLATLDFSE